MFEAWERAEAASRAHADDYGVCAA